MRNETIVKTFKFDAHDHVIEERTEITIEDDVIQPIPHTIVSPYPWQPVPATWQPATYLSNTSAADPDANLKDIANLTGGNI